MIPVLGGGDKGIPGAHWPASLVNQPIPGSVRDCFTKHSEGPGKMVRKVKKHLYCVHLYSSAPVLRWEAETKDPSEAALCSQRGNKTLSHTRWKVRTSTQGCCLSSMYALRHVLVLINKHTNIPTPPCTHVLSKFLKIVIKSG